MLGFMLGIGVGSAWWLLMTTMHLNLIYKFSSTPEVFWLFFMTQVSTWRFNSKPRAVWHSLVKCSGPTCLA